MINYALLADSQAHYGRHGFSRIEVPWTVSDAVSAMTRPPGAVPYKLEHNGKCLVGSAEQSFVYMMVKGYLPAGRYQAVTPCFRDEFFDETHSKYFMKNELIDTESATDADAERCCGIALDFFARHLGACDVVRTQHGWDIECDGLELGSYGRRNTETLEWVYATGCAEPRMSLALKRRMIMGKTSASQYII
jgi:hypothetical protein